MQPSGLPVPVTSRRIPLAEEGARAGAGEEASTFSPARLCLHSQRLLRRHHPLPFRRGPLPTFSPRLLQNLLDVPSAGIAPAAALSARALATGAGRSGLPSRSRRRPNDREAGAAGTAEATEVAEAACSWDS